jgi:hypothetical protein
MNTSLLALLKQIAAEQGEAIFADPERLKPLIREGAKNVPSADKIAFGRCIELGAYQALKNGRTAAERDQIKSGLSRQIQGKTGLDPVSCDGALDLLEAVIFTAPSIGGQHPPQTAPSTKKHFKRNMVIAAAAVVIVLFAILAFPRSDNRGGSSIATSPIKKRVEEAGGRVDGQLRFSIQWNETAYNPNDFDAHCIEPDGNEIYFMNRVNLHSGGNLDVDIINPENGEPAVENITWPSAQRMLEGDYIFFVRCFSYRGGRGGFSAEIEFNGKIYPFVHNRELREDEQVQVAIVNYSARKGFKLK